MQTKEVKNALQRERYKEHREQKLAQNLAWYRENKEARLQKIKEYKLVHPEIYIAASRKYRLANLDEVRRRDREKKAKDAERLRALHVKWLEKNPTYLKEYRDAHKAETRQRSRLWRLQRRYGISVEEFDALLTKQGNACAVCGVAFAEDSDISTPQRGIVNGKYIDHDHATGKVRGIVHMKCNTFMGLADESPELLERAARYLRTFADGLI